MALYIMIHFSPSQYKNIFLNKKQGSHRCEEQHTRTCTSEITVIFGVCLCVSQSAAAAPSPVLGNLPPGDGMPVGPVPPGFFQVDRVHKHMLAQTHRERERENLVFMCCEYLK